MPAPKVNRTGPAIVDVVKNIIDRGFPCDGCTIYSPWPPSSPNGNPSGWG